MNLWGPLDARWQPSGMGQTDDVIPVTEQEAEGWQGQEGVGEWLPTQGKALTPGNSGCSPDRVLPEIALTHLGQSSD